MRKYTLTYLFFFLAFTLPAQVFERLDIPVLVNGTELPNAWAGGLNAPQWSSADLNNDGQSDLYTFDRNGDQHLAFLNTGMPGEAAYRFAPEYVSHFPPCEDFVLLRDYNQDGVMDLFTSSFNEDIQGIKVYTGRYENDRLVFTRVVYPHWTDHVIAVPGNDGNFSHLYVEPYDYPAIDDLDNDGDLDILSFYFDYFQFYENQSAELGLPPDTLVYHLKDTCWGKVQTHFLQSMILSADSCQCPVSLEGSPDNLIHPFPKTFCTFDDDSDGDKELLVGDFRFTTLTYAKNGGTPEDACFISQDTTYPSYDLPVELPDFPAAFYLDADDDGVKDLIASPNLAKLAVDRQNVWYYKNIQSNAFPEFELQQKDFLSEGMIDLGTGAFPAFVDYNADGLTDLVVGNVSWQKGEKDTEASLWLFENTGTVQEPRFEGVDTNYLNFKTYSEDGSSFAFVPAFGDLDADGDLDLLVGEFNGSLFFVENTGGAGNPMAFGPIQPGWQGISVGQYATPCIHDLNGDGLPDLLIGERFGNINYLPNQGTPGNPVFHPNPDEAPNNRFFGEITTQQPGFFTGYSSPVMLTLGDSVFMITGTELGFLRKYAIDPGNLDGGAMPLRDEALGQVREGWITRPAFADLDGDQLLEVVIGNNRGGLGIFATAIHEDGLVAAKERRRPFVEVSVFPNPATDVLFIHFPEPVPGLIEVQVFDVFGKRVTRQFISPNDPLSLQNVMTGAYFLKIHTKDKRYYSRFIKQ